MLYRMSSCRVAAATGRATGTLIAAGAAMALATFALRMLAMVALIALAVLLVILVVRLVRIARQPRPELEAPTPRRLVVDEEALAHRNRMAATLAGTRHTDLIPPVAIHRGCPHCKVLDDHLIAATRHGYRRECRWCRTVWHETA